MACGRSGSKLFFLNKSLHCFLNHDRHFVQQDSVNHLSRNGQQCHTSVIGAGSDITFFGELDEVTLLPFCLYPLVVPDLIKERAEHLHVWPDVDLQCLCWDVVRSRSLAISQLLDSTLNLLLCECTTVNG